MTCLLFLQIIIHVSFCFREKNLVDSLLQRLENYSLHLEEKVEERTELYKSEKDRADSLLYQMLPKGVADQLKRGNVSNFLLSRMLVKSI